MPAHPLILFDGVCNLCSSSVQFIIRNDKAGRFRFAPLQSPTGRALLEGQAHTRNSVVLVEGEKVFTQSTAALRIARRLDGIWPLLYAFIVVPAPIRDGVYQFVARNRYRWFGKQDSCWVPSPELRRRFVDVG